MAQRRLPRASQLAPLVVRVLRVLGCVVRVFGRLAYELGHPAYVFGRLVQASASFGASLRRTDTVTMRDSTDVKKAHKGFLGIDDVSRPPAALRHGVHRPRCYGAVTAPKGSDAIQLSRVPGFLQIANWEIWIWATRKTS
jgi:hypothetical protein